MASNSPPLPAGSPPLSTGDQIIGTDNQGVAIILRAPPKAPSTNSNSTNNNSRPSIDPSQVPSDSSGRKPVSVTDPNTGQQITYNVRTGKYDILTPYTTITAVGNSNTGAFTTRTSTSTLPSQDPSLVKQVTDALARGDDPDAIINSAITGNPIFPSQNQQVRNLVAQAQAQYGARAGFEISPTQIKVVENVAPQFSSNNNQIGLAFGNNYSRLTKEATPMAGAQQNDFGNVFGVLPRVQSNNDNTMGRNTLFTVPSSAILNKSILQTKVTQPKEATTLKIGTDVSVLQKGPTRAQAYDEGILSGFKFDLENTQNRFELNYQRTGDPLVGFKAFSLGGTMAVVDTAQFIKNAFTQSPVKTLTDVSVGVLTLPKTVFDTVKELPTDSPVTIGGKTGYGVSTIAMSEIGGAITNSVIGKLNGKASSVEVQTAKTRSISIPSDQGMTKFTASDIIAGKEKLTANTISKIVPDVDDTRLVSQYTTLRNSKGKVVGVQKTVGTAYPQEGAASIASYDYVGKVNEKSGLSAKQYQGKTNTLFYDIAENSRAQVGVSTSKFISGQRNIITSASDVQDLTFETIMGKEKIRVSPSEYAKIQMSEGKLIYKEVPTFKRYDQYENALPIEKIDNPKRIVSNNPLKENYVMSPDNYGVFVGGSAFPDKIPRIFINKELSAAEKEITTAHELVHFKTPDLFYDVEYNLGLRNLPYRAQPAEILAFGLEKKYAKKGFATIAEKDITLKGAKTDTFTYGVESDILERPVRFTSSNGEVEVSGEKQGIFSKGSFKSFSGNKVADFIKDSGMDFESQKVVRTKELAMPRMRTESSGQTTVQNLKLSSATIDQSTLAKQYAITNQEFTKQIVPTVPIFSPKLKEDKPSDVMSLLKTNTAGVVKADTMIKGLGVTEFKQNAYMKPIESLAQRNLQKAKTIDATQLSILASTSQSQKSKSSLSQELIQIQSFLPVQKIMQEPAQSQKQLQETRQIQELDHRRPNTISITKTKIKPLFYIPSIPLDLKNSDIAFNVEVRSKGKKVKGKFKPGEFMRVNRNPLTMIDAKTLGEEKVLSTAKMTFRLVPVIAKPGARESSGSFDQNKVQVNKKGYFVQTRKSAISSYGEKREITSKAKYGFSLK